MKVPTNIFDTRTLAATALVILGTAPIPDRTTAETLVRSATSASGVCERIVAATGSASDWHCINARVFDDGSDRVRINELRHRERGGGVLTAHEEAILEAANRFGVVSMCNKLPGQHSGGLIGQGSLIWHRDRLAVVTAAHTLIDPETGQLRCPAEQLENSIFFANATYAGDRNDFALFATGLDLPPLNMKRYMDLNDIPGLQPSQDFLIFYLKVNIADDEMPDGRVRGALLPVTQDIDSLDASEGHLVGFHADMDNGALAAYQLGCSIVQRQQQVFHTCDTAAGSSGSALLVFEEGEMRLAGINTSALAMGDGMLSREITDPSYSAIWNGGALASTIFKAEE